MSARNYTTCPQCKTRREAERTKRQTELQKWYGTMDSSKWAREWAKTEGVVTLPESLAEYYEFEFAANAFTVRYNCVCIECGFEFKFVDAVPVPKES